MTLVIECPIISPIGNIVSTHSSDKESPRLGCARIESQEFTCRPPPAPRSLGLQCTACSQSSREGVSASIWLSAAKAAQAVPQTEGGCWKGDHPVMGRESGHGGKELIGKERAGRDEERGAHGCLERGSWSTDLGEPTRPMQRVINQGRHGGVFSAVDAPHLAGLCQSCLPHGLLLQMLLQLLPEQRSQLQKWSCEPRPRGACACTRVARP